MKQPPEPAELFGMNADKDGAKLAEAYGGVGGLAAALGTDAKRGLADEATVGRMRTTYGANVYRQVPPKSFFRILFEGFKDPVILLLCAAATLSTVLGASLEEERHEKKWVEGIAIWLAIFLVTTVAALNDWQKDRQFRKLNAQRDIIEVKVVRGGKTLLVKNADVVVGDLLLLDCGDKVIADGVVMESLGLVLDEASLTGESDPIKKTPSGDPWVRSGTQVSEGSGKMVVVAVGDSSEWGKTIGLVTSAGDEETPLQEKLAHVAALVGKVGATVAATCFVALLIKWCVVNRGFPLSKINQNGPVQFFLYAVTIVVVAIPEGLPLAVTMALAYSMKKMMRDNNFVRVLAACETMGGATAICSDKTGTLTENRMTVVEGWFGGSVDGGDDDANGSGSGSAPLPAADELGPALRESLALNAALNSKAFLIEHGADLVEFVGNRTECALLMMARRWGADYKALRDARGDDVAHVFQFSSAKKMASVVLRQQQGGLGQGLSTEEHLLVLNKGAAEWVLAKCTSVWDARLGAAVPLTDARRERLMQVVVGMASRGLRCICLAQRALPLHDPSRPADFFETSDGVDSDLTAVAVVGIKDPVRAEVPRAVATCQRAGITVRMVTGDNIHTARHIARECGILTDGGVALEGPTFRGMPLAELLPLLPKLQVLARSSPEDKLTLVSLLKHHGDVVAVTGDGTNDAPALKESDVGLAMGVAGTEVAKEAADIVILDDNFSSIVKSVLWGRSVFASIRKFLQFQLTVNFVALVVSFVGALVGGRMPLNVLQLLWVNLIMDTMGALALATEEPPIKLLDAKPHGRSEPLISGKMFKHIVAQGFYQIFWMFLFLYGLPGFLPALYGLTPRCDVLADPLVCVDDVAVRQLGYARADAERLCGYVASQQCGSSGGGDARLAICGGADSCPDYDAYAALLSALERRVINVQDADFLRLASVLFNTFIWAQIFNLVNARRIDDEFNVFQHLHRSHLFLAILGVIVLCQVIIINFLGAFFKVERLTWQEWLVTVAIGAGAMLWSLVVRAASRALAPPSRPSDDAEGGKQGGGGLWAALCARLARLNQVNSKHLAAAAAVYQRSGELSVQEAVGLARGSAAAAEAEAGGKDGGEGGEEEKVPWWRRCVRCGGGKNKQQQPQQAGGGNSGGIGGGGFDDDDDEERLAALAAKKAAAPVQRGRAGGRHMQRTLSGRSDSAASLAE